MLHRPLILILRRQVGDPPGLTAIYVHPPPPSLVLQPHIPTPPCSITMPICTHLPCPRTIYIDLPFISIDIPSSYCVVHHRTSGTPAKGQGPGQGPGKGGGTPTAKGGAGVGVGGSPTRKGSVGSALTDGMSPVGGGGYRKKPVAIDFDS